MLTASLAAAPQGHSEQHGNGDCKRQETEAPSSQTASASHLDLNFPLPGEKGPSCLVKVHFVSNKGVTVHLFVSNSNYTDVTAQCIQSNEERVQVFWSSCKTVCFPTAFKQQKQQQKKTLTDWLNITVSSNETQKREDCLLLSTQRASCGSDHDGGLVSFNSCMQVQTCWTH